jgi:ATP-dependent DNA ligase
MNIDKRDFTNFTNKKFFPGIVNKTTGEYNFPKLYHIDTRDNTRMWKITIRLIKGPIKKHCIDWNLMEDNTIPIKKEYLLDQEIPDGTIAQVWVETGVITGKISRHMPSYPKVMNEGKTNERNVLKQGLVYARSLYLKKIENGMTITKNNKSDTTNKKNNKNVKYFPMLVRKYENEKKNMVYPLYVQPKLDGARCIAFLNKTPAQKPTFENVIMYSRQKKDYFGFDEMRKELLPVLIDMWDFENNESIYVDGELYNHGMDLQTISGAVRNPKRKDILKYKNIQFFVFDVFYYGYLELSFKKRIELITDMFNGFANNIKCIVKVDTHLVATESDQEKLYKQYLKKDYEGIILRNVDSLYLTHPTKNNMSIRSKNVLKRKMTYSDEFEVVDFDQGSKGRDIGAIMWVLKTLTSDKTFNATPKNTTYEERYKLFKQANSSNKQGFNDNFKGRMMTIEYEDLSKDNVPLRAKSIGFRDHI